MLTQIVRAERGFYATFCRCSQSSNVTASKIDDMDEVSNSGSIRSVPVRTEDVEHRFRARQHTGDDWDQVAGFLPGIFAKDTGFMAANLNHRR